MGPCAHNEGADRCRRQKEASQVDGTLRLLDSLRELGTGSSQEVRLPTSYVLTTGACTPEFPEVEETTRAPSAEPRAGGNRETVL